MPSHHKNLGGMNAVQEALRRRLGIRTKGYMPKFEQHVRRGGILLDECRACGCTNGWEVDCNFTRKRHRCAFCGAVRVAEAVATGSTHGR